MYSIILKQNSLHMRRVEQLLRAMISSFFFPEVLIAYRMKEANEYTYLFAENLPSTIIYGTKGMVDPHLYSAFLFDNFEL